jgi:hypothetical protein
MNFKLHRLIHLRALLFPMFKLSFSSKSFALVMRFLQQTEAVHKLKKAIFAAGAICARGQ